MRVILHFLFARELRRADALPHAAIERVHALRFIEDKGHNQAITLKQNGISHKQESGLYQRFQMEKCQQPASTNGFRAPL